MTSSRFIPKCVVLTVVAGIVCYYFYSFVLAPANEITCARLTFGNKLCDCQLHATDQSRLFYNRIPKCGSLTLLTLMKQLSARNNYIHFNSKLYHNKSIDEVQQRRVVKDLKSFPSPCSYDRHVFFIDFTKFGESPPLFMNMIRDPVERIISSYFYRRERAKKSRIEPSANWLNKKFEHCVLSQDPECIYLDGHAYIGTQVPYFCGHELECQYLNHPAALQKAKQNIEKYYSVVGTLEQINITVKVLETLLPHFFEGAYETYQTMGVHYNHNLHKEQVKEEVKNILSANLTAEYELYHFVQQRLYYQYQTLVEVPPVMLMYMNA